jgi:sugar lactone lactonase YvrE
MTLTPSSISSLNTLIVSRELPLRLQTFGGRLIAGCVLTAALIIGFGGIAVGQTAHFTGAQTTVGSGFYEPFGVAVDSSGNLYVADADTFTIYEILAVNGTIAASPTIRSLAKASSNPENITVDSSGNVYYTDLDTSSNFQNNTVKEILAVNGSIPASPTIRQLGSGLFYPGGVAVDVRGNVYVADTDNGVVKEILAVNGSIPASPTIITLGSGFYTPKSVAVDSAGNVYVAATDSASSVSEVIEILAVNGSIPPSPTILKLASGFCGTDGVALDSSGDVFFSAYCNNAVYEIMAVNGTIPPTPTINEVRGGFPGIEGLAVDKSGNVYVGGVYNAIPEIMASGTHFGVENIGATSQSIPLSFSFDSAGTLGSTTVLTQGAPGLDFTDEGTGTCKANTTYIYGSMCTVNVIFTPKFAGTRYGAAVLKDGSGNVIAAGYVQGTGVGPQVNFLPGAQSTIPAAGLSYTGQVAVDGSGSLYITDWANNRVLKETQAANTYTQSTIGSGFNAPMGIAVDGSGNIYIADTYNNRVLIETPSAGGYFQSTVGSGLSLPMRVAVDGSGNIYIADYGNQRVVKETLSAGVYTQSVVASSGLNGPSGVAADGSGNVYIADVFNNRVLKETLSAAGYTESTVGSSSLSNPNGVAVDGNGNIYVSDTGHDRVLKESPSTSGYIESTIASGLSLPADVALDGGGNVYISETDSRLILKVDFADPPSLTFASTPVGSLSTDSPQTVTVENIGNAAMAFPIPPTGNNPSITANFSLDSGGGSACPLVGSGSFQPATLAAGASCELPISFAPGSAGALNGSLVLMDNNLNAAAPGYNAQSITLSGTSTRGTPIITWHTPAAIPYGTVLSAAQLNATASVAGTFSYDPAAGTIPPLGTDTLTMTFTPTDTTDYTTAQASVTLTVGKATPTITWATPTPITYGTALDAAQLNASSPVGGTFVYSPAAGTVLSPGQQTLTVKFTPTDSADYSTAFGSVVLTVNKATPVVTWPTPAPITYGTALSATQLNASANVPGTFAYNPAAGTVLPAGTNTLTTIFTPTDTQDYVTPTAFVLLTVTPNFTLSAISGSIAIVQNNSGTNTISVTGVGGFTGSVKLSASGMPNGVTTSFGTNPTATTSVLTFKVGPKATPGTFSITITGSSGSLTRTTSIALTIVARK